MLITTPCATEGDTATIDAKGGNDTIDASGMIDDDPLIDRVPDMLALKFIGATGDDTLVGSPFADSIDSGLGNDRVTGGLGTDTCLDAGGNDTLVESEDLDIGLFGNHLVMGTIVGDGRVFIEGQTRYAAHQVRPSPRTRASEPSRSPSTARPRPRSATTPRPRR